MSNIILDIETAGLSDDDPRLAELIAEASPPGNMKKPETIEAWRKEKAPALVKKSTSFDAAAGRIVSAAWAVDDSEISGKTSPDERRIIDRMFESIGFELTQSTTRGHVDTIVGHNVLGFDLGFLRKRCILHGIKLPVWFPKDLRPWSEEVFDTMLKWDSDKNKMISQTKLAKLLGIEVDESVDGSMVQAMWEAGEHEKILDYNCDDVRICREIYRKMSYVLGL